MPFEVRRRRALHGIARGAAVLCAVSVFPIGCGFRPRGSGVAFADPGRVFVDADRGLTVATELRDALLARGFSIAANRDEAKVLLRVSGEEVAERIVSVQRNGRVSEYELTHAVKLVVARAEGDARPDYRPDQVANRVEVSREYTYDETEVLGKENEARILRLEMRRELVRQIVLRTLASLAPVTAQGPPERTE